MESLILISQIGLFIGDNPRELLRALGCHMELVARFVIDRNTLYSVNIPFKNALT